MYHDLTTTHSVPTAVVQLLKHIYLQDHSISSDESKYMSTSALHPIEVTVLQPKTLIVFSHG